MFRIAKKDIYEFFIYFKLKKKTLWDFKVEKKSSKLIIISESVQNHEKKTSVKLSL